MLTEDSHFGWTNFRGAGQKPERPGTILKQLEQITTRSSTEIAKEVRFETLRVAIAVTKVVLDFPIDSR